MSPSDKRFRVYPLRLLYLIRSCNAVSLIKPKRMCRKLLDRKLLCRNKGGSKWNIWRGIGEGYNDDKGGRGWPALHSRCLWHPTIAARYTVMLNCTGIATAVTFESVAIWNDDGIERWAQQFEIRITVCASLFSPPTPQLQRFCFWQNSRFWSCRHEPNTKCVCRRENFHKFRWTIWISPLSRVNGLGVEFG